MTTNVHIEENSSGCLLKTMSTNDHIEEKKRLST